MFMEIKVNLSDIYPEVDGCNNHEGGCEFDSIKDAIKNEITYAIKDEIMKQIGEDLKAAIKEAVKEKVLLHLDIKIKKKVRQLMREGTITPDRYSNNPIKITNHIENLFKSNGNWLAEGEIFLKEHTTEVARRFSLDLKNKYDMIFAAKIVDNLGKAGLLKDEAVKKLVA